MEFLKFVFGLREAYTSDTEAEIELLVNLSKNKSQIIEVGVNESVGSVRFFKEISEGKHRNWKVVGIVDSITAISAA